MLQQSNSLVFIHVEVPGIVGLQTYDGSALAIISAMCLNDADIFQPMIFSKPSHYFTDLLAAALPAFFARANV